MQDAERTLVFDASEKLVQAWERYERAPNPAHLHDLKVAVGGFRRLHRRLLEGIVDGLPRTPDPEEPLPWWQRD